ncbi:Crp/Fnr family transcriptional regulator [Streptomyces goshikiensis]|uniref:Crp/Fnr family transcriptional regulator n=1 Tax=Streptomyces goshikiensis TaxID=1942 RepID=UPI00364C46CE
MMHGSSMYGRAPFLDTLTDGARTAFALLGTRSTFAVGDVLIKEGDRAQELMLLHKGVVKVTGRLDGDGAALMDIRVEGEVVGEVAAMDFGPRSATVTACGDVVATVVPRCELLPFLRANPEAELALKRVIGSRLRRSDRWRLDFGRHPVLVRLARVLVELALAQGKPGRNSVRIEVNLSQSEFAALAGAKTDTVQKMLRRLREDGLITTGERRTQVRDLARLQEVALLSMPVT